MSLGNLKFLSRLGSDCVLLPSDNTSAFLVQRFLTESVCN